jgi:hypothetical protein
MDWKYAGDLACRLAIDGQPLAAGSPVNREGVVMRQDSGTSDGKCLVLSNVSAVYSSIMNIRAHAATVTVPDG